MERLSGEEIQAVRFARDYLEDEAEAGTEKTVEILESLLFRAIMAEIHEGPQGKRERRQAGYTKARKTMGIKPVVVEGTEYPSINMARRATGYSFYKVKRLIAEGQQT